MSLLSLFMNLTDPKRLNSSLCIIFKLIRPLDCSSHKAWFIFSQVFITCKWNSIRFYCRVEIKTHFTHTDRMSLFSLKETDLVHKLPIKSCCSNLTNPTKSLYVGYIIDSGWGQLFIKGQYLGVDYEGIYCSHIFFLCSCIFNFMLALCKVLLRLSFQLLQQLKRLICDLCRLYNLPQHPDVEMLDQPLPAAPLNQDRKVSAIHEQSLSKLQLLNPN